MAPSGGAGPILGEFDAVWLADSPSVEELVLVGGRVLRGGSWAEEDLGVRDGVIAAGPPSEDADRIDARGRLVAPGFIDLQCNGGLGIDLTSDPAGLWDLARALPRWGVTAWLPTIVTAPPGAVDAAIEVLAGGPPAGWTGAVPLGLHLEGPFLAGTQRGAHPNESLRSPSREEAAGWSCKRGVALVTLAPELPGALELIATLVARGVIVSLGHSAATSAQAEAAIDAGARWVTHLFNAMAPFHHREPGLAGRALDDDRVRVGIIADGTHVGPEALRLARRCLGPRLTLVTDAAPALGVEGAPAASRTGDGTLAGGTVPLDGVVRTYAELTGCPPAEALAAASTAPAAVMGDRSRGVLEVGSRADLVLLDEHLGVEATWVGGRMVHQRGLGPRTPVAGFAG